MASEPGAGRGPLPATSRTQPLLAMDSRRAVYRITYPLAERPAFVMGRREHAVVDCSERGLRFELSGAQAPALNSVIDGIVRFRRGEQVQVTGAVLRSDGCTAVIVLQGPGIAFSHIIAEQRYLLSRGFDTVHT